MSEGRKNVRKLTLDQTNRKSEMLYTVGQSVTIKAIKENEFHFFRVMKYESIDGGERGSGKTNYSDHEVVSSNYTHFQIEYMSETSMNFEIITDVRSDW